jgi:hypothetical protein
MCTTLVVTGAHRNIAKNLIHTTGASDREETHIDSLDRHDHYLEGTENRHNVRPGKDTPHPLLRSTGERTGGPCPQGRLTSGMPQLPHAMREKG